MSEHNFSEVHANHIEHLRRRSVTVDDEGLLIGDQYVMFFAEADLMRLHVQGLLRGRTDLDVLEVGLGLGVFAEQLIVHGFRSYTAVEPHADVVSIAQQSLLREHTERTKIIADPWQLATYPPESFDAIMYDTWPPDGCADADFAQFVESVALPALRRGGRFSFFVSGCELSGSRRSVLEKNFSSYELTRYEMPAKETPKHWTKPTRHFIIPIASKG